MFKAWLCRRADADAIQRYSRDPTWYIDPEAAHVAEHLRQGGELWEFCSPPETWKELMGWAGFAVVRDGEIVASIVTQQN